MNLPPDFKQYNEVYIVLSNNNIVLCKIVKFYARVMGDDAIRIGNLVNTYVMLTLNHIIYVDWCVNTPVIATGKPLLIVGTYIGTCHVTWGMKMIIYVQQFVMVFIKYWAWPMGWLHIVTRRVRWHIWYLQYILIKILTFENGQWVKASILRAKLFWKWIFRQLYQNQRNWAECH